MPKHGYRYYLYVYEPTKIPFSYEIVNRCYAHDYRGAFIKLILPVEVHQDKIKQYFIGISTTYYPKAAQDIFNRDRNGIMAQMERYRTATTQTVANKIARMHTLYARTKHSADSRKNKTPEQILESRNQYQRTYMHKKRAYEKWRDTIISITGDVDDVPPWNLRTTDTPWNNVKQSQAYDDYCETLANVEDYKNRLGNGADPAMRRMLNSKRVYDPKIRKRLDLTAHNPDDDLLPGGEREDEEEFEF